MVIQMNRVKTDSTNSIEQNIMNAFIKDDIIG